MPFEVQPRAFTLNVIAYTTVRNTQFIVTTPTILFSKLYLPLHF